MAAGHVTENAPHGRLVHNEKKNCDWLSERSINIPNIKGLDQNFHNTDFALVQ